MRARARARAEQGKGKGKYKRVHECAYSYTSLYTNVYIYALPAGTLDVASKYFVDTLSDEN